ncbi:unnamed protein product [Durusdinium trenchii]|uniref:Uncharacterized protein n=2 Tax=Durusdinium trenchii TaxID=1381693 RepID=A0ABP0LNX7_9DINO
MDAVCGERSDASREKDLESSETSVPRPSSALKQETCLVFDWDDTILPTSWLERIHALAGGGPLRPEVQRQLASLSSAAAQTLQLAASMGTVVIITNSAPGWVDQSCQIFMPQILQQIRSYQIFAKPLHAPLTFKISTFRRECKKFMNLISIGDGDAERAASLRLQAPERKGSFGEERQRVKSVKLIELPTCQQLIVQHEMLQVRLPDVTAFLGCLDLKSRFPSSSSPGKAAGPTLVHFGRPTGMLVSPTTPVRETQVVASPHRAVGGQLPPLSGPGKAGEAELSPSREKESGEASTVPTDRPLSSRAGELGLGAPIETENLGIQRGTPSNQSPPGIWKVQGVGSGRDGRTLFSAHKKRPVLASVGVGGRPPGSVWRDHVAAGKGF